MEPKNIRSVPPDKKKQDGGKSWAEWKLELAQKHNKGSAALAEYENEAYSSELIQEVQDSQNVGLEEKSQRRIFLKGARNISDTR